LKSESEDGKTSYSAVQENALGNNIVLISVWRSRCTCYTTCRYSSWFLLNLLC